MKNGVIIGVSSSYPLPTAKRRWRGLALAVLVLVILSIVAHLAFFLGLHNSRSVPEQHSSIRNDLIGSNNAGEQRKDLITNPVDKMVNETDLKGSVQVVQQSEDHPEQQHPRSTIPDTNLVKFSSSDTQVGSELMLDENGMSCELRFGSYCLWHREHREAMKDSVVKKMKDRLFVARAYYPSVAKLPAHDNLSQQIRQNIQEFERILSEATLDADLPSEIEMKLQTMETVISRAKSLHVECSNVDKKQSAFLYQLSVQTMPKSLHCLSMRLTVEYFHSPSLDADVSAAENFVNPSLYHYVVFSKNILASSVVINSTVAHAKESRKLVFHVLTEQQNYFAMKLWFSRNIFKEAAVQVLNVEDHVLDSGDKSIDQLSLPEEFRVSFQNDDKLSKMLSRTIYLSMFSYPHYLVPGIFKNLDKVVILDDDVLVQQDLSPLWSINMKGKVNGAVEYCAVELGQLNSYISIQSYNKKSCVWMSGLNIVDLARWRELNVTGSFRRLAGQLNADSRVSKAVASLASLLAFQDLVYALDPSWVLSGLGHDYRLGEQAISKAAILHYNGNMKPWLDLGIPRYRSLWTKFLNQEDMLLRDCNVIA